MIPGSCHWKELEQEPNRKKNKQEDKNQTYGIQCTCQNLYHMSDLFILLGNDPHCSTYCESIIVCGVLICMDFMGLIYHEILSQQKGTFPLVCMMELSNQRIQESMN